MFTLCRIALVPVEFINISHTTYNIGFLFTHTNSWPLCHSLPGTVWTGIRTIVEVKKVWSRIGTYWADSKKKGVLTTPARCWVCVSNVFHFQLKLFMLYRKQGIRYSVCMKWLLKCHGQVFSFIKWNFWLSPFFSTCIDFCSSNDLAGNLRDGGRLLSDPTLAYLKIINCHWISFGCL